MLEQIGAHLKRARAAYSVLLLGMLLTLIAWRYVYSTVQADAALRFRHATRSARDVMRQTLGRDTDILFAGRGFVEGSSSLTPSHWRVFVRSLHLAEHDQGVAAVGFAPKVLPWQRQTFAAQMRREGLHGFKIYPPTKLPYHFPITFVGGTMPINRAALGFDLASDPLRLAAILKACENNVPAMSSKVHVVAIGSAGRRRGLLVCLPVYYGVKPPAQTAQRLWALRGVVYLLMKPRTLFRSVLSGTRAAWLLRFSVYNGPVAAANLVYSNGHNGRRSQPLTLPVAGQQWTVVFQPAHQMLSRGQQLLPILVLLGGSLFAWLLFGISWQQKRAQEASDRVGNLLRVSEERYRTQVEQSPLAIQIFSPDGQTSYVNRAWEKLWAVDRQEAMQHNILTSPPMNHGELVGSIRQAFEGRPVEIPDTFYAAGEMRPGCHNRTRWVRSFLYPTKDPQGRVLEVVWLYEDITERKLAEEQLQAAKQAAEAANQAKDQFLAVLSHELRNPLAPVLTMVNMLQQEMLQPSERPEALEVIRRNVELEARLIDDLLDVTRITRGKLTLNLECVEANTLVHQALETCSVDLTNKRIEVDVQAVAARHAVFADPARLQQIFWNLIKNAIKFTPAGGRLTIRTSNPQLDRAMLPPQCQGPRAPAPGAVHDGDATYDFLQVDVIDSGIGIAQENLTRIFDAFEQGTRTHTQQFGGLGLGLAISKALVEAHIGKIFASSEGTNKGATFTVLLPLAEVPAPITPSRFPDRPAPPRKAAAAEAPNRELQQLLTGGDGPATLAPANAAPPEPAAEPCAVPCAAHPPAPPAPDPAAARILLVEDQDDARRALATLLEKMGYRVRAAANVADAMQVAGQWDFDLLISDLGLPDASGLDLVRSIKQSCPVKCIALSGYGMDQDIADSRAAGFDCHLTKPVNLMQLEATIHALTQA